MQVAVTEFKAKCTKLFRTVEQDNETIEITRRGKVIAVVVPPTVAKPDPEQFLGCLQNTVTFSPDWDEPLGEDNWEACLIEK